jgi:hypothetical protein
MKTIQLTNQTHYNSRDLTKLFTIALAFYKRTAFDFKFTTVKVKCIYRRKHDGFCGGYAYYNNNFICMKLPKIKKGYDGETFEQTIMRTFLHELDHCRGRKHGDMPNDKHRNISFIPDGYSIKEKEPKVKKKKTDDDKIAALIKRKKSWKTKMKRAETAMKKIDKQIVYYNRKRNKITQPVV